MTIFKAILLWTETSLALALIVGPLLALSEPEQRDQLQD